MSRSEITCSKCGKPVAVRHHRGRLRVAHEVKAIEVSEEGVWVTCSCGESRLLRLPAKTPDRRVA